MPSQYTCHNCGVTFFAKPSERRKYCSYQCRCEAGREQRQCPTCKNTFTAHVSAHRKYCSRSCYFHLGLEDRFWSFVERRSSHECWEWQGSRRGRRYGALRVGDQQEGAHRVSWLIHFGEIPDGLYVCHKCDNPMCVNPNHLFLGTPLVNTMDRDAKGRHVLPLGDKHHNSRLTDDQVREIRSSGASSAELAEKYGVTYGHVWGIRRGERRKMAN